MPETVEYMVSSANMDTIRSHRWEVNTGGELVSIIREWTWNYRRDEYSEWRTTYTMDITPEGIVEHDGRPLPEYAEARVNTLTNKRGVHGPTVERVV